ncbi:MAG: DUF429 domain-containing protein [Chloroflexi bacterium]|nr:DUF429 domain-containing protein [Chloroflexota bacterium]
MTKIIGVDFSGARGDNNTWATFGNLDGQDLTLESCARITRAELTRTLAECRGPTVAALDFPFATPKAFADYWLPGSAAMPELWSAAAELEYDDFLGLRDRFVALYGEPKRACDPPESYSCLHMVNPIMLPMTFRGMQMLNRLWFGDTRNPVSVPPLPEHSRQEGDGVTELLEVMPGAVLRRLGLPFKGYKGGAKAGERRRRIVSELPTLAAPIAFNFGEFEGIALKSHDALDSVVAAVAAALWSIDRERFPQPPVEGKRGYDPIVLLEGWLYAPERANGPGSGVPIRGVLVDTRADT